LLARNDLVRAPARHGARLPHALLGGLSTVGLGAGVAALITAMAAVRVSPDTAHSVRVAGQTLSYPAVNVAALLVLLVALAGAAAVVRMTSALWRCVRDQRRFARCMAEVDAGARIVVLAGEEVLIRCFVSEPAEAFCAGFLRPKIYVSTGALTTLTARELDAVVAHERNHQIARDPLRSMLEGILSKGLFFLPALSRLQHAAELQAEIDADAFALRISGGDGQPLAAAMMQMSSGPRGTVSGIRPERVDHLLAVPVKRRLPLILTGIALATVTAMVAVLWESLHAATISATLSLPFVSRQPCVLVLAVIPGLLGLLALKLPWPRPGHG
jgi:beta-lactamase regulating signal transducer with metallopeptidase domain